LFASIKPQKSEE